MEKIIQQGAEAKIILSKGFVIKNRISKGYRIKELDEKIRRQRTKSEAKLLEKASDIINSPKPLFIPEFTKIKMPFIQGKKLSENLDKFPLKKQKEICKNIGLQIAKLHDADIVHGDLTTSNMIFVKRNFNKKISGVGGRRDGGGTVFLIDFGLGFISQRFEDKAVDLHLLKEALEAKHFQHWEVLFENVLQGYKISKHFEPVLKQFKKVESRGRYKEKY